MLERDPSLDAARWWTGFAGRCYDPWLTFRIPGFQTCAKTPSSSASPACSSACSSAGSSAASRRRACAAACRCAGDGDCRPGADRRRRSTRVVPQRLRSAAERDPRDAETRIAAREPLLRRRTVRRRGEVVRGGAASSTPKDVNVSTDLGDQLLLHEPAGQGARAVRASLAIDPKHAKTLLNVGIVRAFGKQDLEGAAKAWQQVLDVAPDRRKHARPGRRSTACAARIQTSRAAHAKQPGS